MLIHIDVCMFVSAKVSVKFPTFIWGDRVSLNLKLISLTKLSAVEFQGFTYLHPRAQTPMLGLHDHTPALALTWVPEF